MAATTSQQRTLGVSKRRNWIIAIAALLGVIVILAGIKAGQIGTMIKAGKSFVMPPEAVTSAKVEATEWQASRSAIGSLVAVRSVNLASEVAGLVREIGFDSGSFVRKDQVLVKMDTSTEEAQLASARLNAMNERFRGRLPWALAFSYSRAVQQPALDAWKGDAANIEPAQKALVHRARCNQAARRGAYDALADAPSGA